MEYGGFIPPFMLKKIAQNCRLVTELWNSTVEELMEFSYIWLIHAQQVVLKS